MRNDPKQLIADISHVQLPKHGEDICGDQVLVSSTDDSSVVVLSDGLGSGVKANILSTMTVKMASTMLTSGSSVDEVMETMAETLPICRERKLAYSTLTLLQLHNDGRVYLAEYDNPPAFIGRGRCGMTISRSQRQVEDRTVREARFRARPGDWLVLVSDGVLHAGIGGRWNLGWGWDRVEKYVRTILGADYPADGAADEIARVVNKLYRGRPGDDASVVVIRLKRPNYLTVMIGPPERQDDDPRVVEKLMELPGRKAVCGGTTGKIVARILHEEIEVNLATDRNGIPPTAQIRGVDLVTEGMLTISRVLQNIRGGETNPQKLRSRRDGASKLTCLLLEADRITFLIGRAINPAHQAEDIPRDLALKSQVVGDLVDELREMGREVRAEMY